MMAILTSFGLKAQFIENRYSFVTDQTKHSQELLTTIPTRLIPNDDRTIYYTETFDGLTLFDGSEGWTAAIQNGNVGFQLTSIGHANSAGSSFVIPALNTTTPSQWIVLDSDSYGQSGVDEQATLTSNPIDLTMGGTVTVPPNLRLEFDQFFAEWETAPNFDTLFIAVSDDGLTWHEIIQSDDVGRNNRPNPEHITWDISSLALNPSQIQVRFRWHGNYAYGWQIDNVTFSELPLNDLTITEVFRGDIINDFMFSKVPIDQAAPFTIGAVIKNIGYLSQTNINFTYSIANSNNTVVATGTGFTPLAQLDNGDFDTIWVNTAYQPIDLGQYSITFTAIADQTDDDPTNNAYTDNHFELTEDLYGADYGPINTIFSNWVNNNNNEASIGTVLQIRNDGIIGAIDAMIYDDTNVIGEQIYYTLYKFFAPSFIPIAITDEYELKADDLGEIKRLYLDEQSPVEAGDLVLVTAAHFGGTPSVGYPLAGRVPVGQIAGYNPNAGTSDNITFLISPEAPVVRAVMRDFTSVSQNEQPEPLQLYPNPVYDHLKISVNTPVEMLDDFVIYNSVGQIIERIAITNSTATISVAHLPAGIYYITIGADQNNVGMQRFIKL